MIKNFEDRVIDALNGKEILTNKYFGEFSNPENVQVDLNSLPAVYVDYTGSNPDGRIKEEHTFHLYIAHLSYSNNRKNRALKHDEIYDLFEDIKQALNLKSFEGSDPVKWGAKNKIFDAVTDKGYLTVFTQSFTAIL